MRFRRAELLVSRRMFEGHAGLRRKRTAAVD